MIVIASIRGIVIDSVLKEFDSKPQEGKEPRHFKLNEITFFSPDINITGILKDWDLTIPHTALKAGDKIVVNFNRCAPCKGLRGIFEFTGFPVISK